MELSDRTALITGGARGIGKAIALEQQVHTAPVLGDVNHDGYLEAVFCGTGKVYAFALNGPSASPAKT